MRGAAVVLFVYSSLSSTHHCTKQNNSETWSTSTKVIKAEERFAPEAKSKQEGLIMNGREEHDKVNAFL